MTAIKKTLLYDWHGAAGANMAPFGQYQMPLWYRTGVKAEHLAVLTAAGIFDTSHMAAVKVAGPGAEKLLRNCFSKDLGACLDGGRAPLTPGRGVYGVFLAPDGGVIDDAIVFQTDADIYLVIVNAGMGAPVCRHLQAHVAGSGVTITDLTDRLGKLDLQGPGSARILASVLRHPDQVLDRLPYFSFKGHFNPSRSEADTVRLVDGTPILLSRTGYTGEFGFEIFVEPDRFVALWQMLLEAGAGAGLVPCGLAARDSLRTGALLPLSHQDIGPWPFINNPWTFALPWARNQKGFSKSFIGAEALLSATPKAHTLAYVGYDLRKVSVPATVLDRSGESIGTVLTCTTDMGIGWGEDRIWSVASPDRPIDFRPRGLACGFIKTDLPLAAGERVVLADRRRRLEVQITDDIRPDRTARRPLSGFLPGRRKP